MKTLTIHRALAELKTLDARIQAAIQAVDPVGVRQLDKPVMTAGGSVYADAERFEALAKANLDSAQQLIRNKAALKAAIVKSLLEDYSIMLQNDCEYLTSDKSIIEMIEAHEYFFTENGKIA
jgi:hypothetical protein